MLCCGGWLLTLLAVFAWRLMHATWIAATAGITTAASVALLALHLGGMLQSSQRESTMTIAFAHLPICTSTDDR